jgi:undecaprenyl-diphosphatase
MNLFLSITDIDRDLTLALNGSESMFWNNLMTVFTNTLSWSLLIAMLLYIFFRNNSPKDAIIILLTIAVMVLVMDRFCSGYVKPTVARWRPSCDPDIMYLVDVVNNYRSHKYGFFSGHASNTMCVAMFLSWLFRYRKLTIILFVWSSIASYTRIYLGVHYVGDILVGTIAGLLIGYLFYRLYYYLFKRNQQIYRDSEQYTITGYLKSDLDLFFCVILFNYLLLIIISLFLGIR